MVTQGVHSYSYTGIRVPPMSRRRDGWPATTPATRALQDRPLDRDDPGLVLRYLGHRLEVPEPGRVESEDLGLHLIGELRIAVPVDELVRDPELAEGVDLPLRVAPQRRVGPPHDVVRPEVAEQRAEHVGALERPVRHGGRERRAHLGVEVLPLRLEPLLRGEIGRAHVLTPVTPITRMPSSA